MIEIRDDQDYATFTIDQKPDSNYYSLTIESSFGDGYGYAWSAPGNDFRAFLADVDIGYVTSKMVGRVAEVYDGDATAAAIREAIKDLVKAGECDDDLAESENLLCDEVESSTSEVDFWRWSEDTKLFKEREPWFFQRMTPGRRTREFEALYIRFWPTFAKALCERAIPPVDKKERDADLQKIVAAIVEAEQGGKPLAVSMLELMANARKSGRDEMAVEVAGVMAGAHPADARSDK